MNIKDGKTQWTIWAVILVIVGVLVYFTGLTVFSILFGVVLVFGGLWITGVFGELFGKKVEKDPKTGLPTSWYYNDQGNKND